MLNLDNETTISANKVMTKFKDLIQNSEVPVLVDFTAVWCGPCKMMAPILQEFAREVKDKIKVIKVDIDKNPKAAQKYQIKGVPTFILFHKGQIVWQQSGMIPKHELHKVALAHS